MMPAMNINYLAVLVCAVAAMPIGFLWFGPLFGKPWARHMGFGGMQPPGAGQMGRSMAIFFVTNLLIAWVLAHAIEAWQASSWGLSPDAAPWTYAVSAGFFNWLGFFFPMQMNRVAWEKKSWGLVLINSSFDLTRLILFGLILSYWQ